MAGWAGFIWLIAVYIAFVDVLFSWVISVVITCWGKVVVCGQELSAGFHWLSVVVLLGRISSSRKVSLNTYDSPRPSGTTVDVETRLARQDGFEI